MQPGMSAVRTTIMAPFEYLAPTTLEEALALLAAHGEAARPLAGGTDLFLQMQAGRRRPAVVVDLKRLAGLARIEAAEGSRDGKPADGSRSGEPAGGLRIGALVCHAELLADPRLREPGLRALGEAAGWVSGPQIRNRGTVGGNLCNASPAADLAAPLLALGAIVEVGRHRAPPRRLPLAELFAGPGRTTLAADELLLGVVVPPPGAGAAAARTGSAYERAVRVAIDIAVVGVAAAVTLAPDGTVSAARVALAAVAPTPVLSRTAAAALAGRRPTAEVIDEAARGAAADSRPISDVRGSASYRRYLVEVLTRREVGRAVAAAGPQP